MNGCSAVSVRRREKEARWGQTMTNAGELKEKVCLPNRPRGPCRTNAEVVVHYRTPRCHILRCEFSRSLKRERGTEKNSLHKYARNDAGRGRPSHSLGDVIIRMFPALKLLLVFAPVLVWAWNQPQNATVKMS
jgi:hypothetical protein